MAKRRVAGHGLAADGVAGRPIRAVMDFPFHHGHALAMPRPRAFEEEQVVAAAKEVLWEQGYLKTSVGDLEEATGLSRSSLYLAFGSKRDLFAAALRVYLDTFVDPLLGPLESKDAGVREIVGYFKTLGTLFRDPEAQRGCLMINTIGERAGRDPAFTLEGEQFLARLRSAFANALKSSVRANAMTRGEATEHAALLGAAAVGAWITVRVDPAAARALCRSAAAQARSWAPSVD
jgi:TetR/AcrR family transcriptional regulator, transcriptional repressor for nem operon